MAYSTSNPPQLIGQGIGGNGKCWLYKSADAIADVDAAGYFTNAGDLGISTGDEITIIDTTNGLTSKGKVTVTAGAGTATALTAFP